MKKKSVRSLSFSTKVWLLLDISMLTSEKFQSRVPLFIGWCSTMISAYYMPKHQPINSGNRYCNFSEVDKLYVGIPKTETCNNGLR